MPKQVVHNESARRALERGVDQVADTVKITLGSAVRNAVRIHSCHVPHD